MWALGDALGGIWTCLELITLSQPLSLWRDWVISGCRVFLFWAGWIAGGWHYSSTIWMIPVQLVLEKQWKHGYASTGEICSCWFPDLSVFECVFFAVCKAVVELWQIDYERMTLDGDVDPVSARTSSWILVSAAVRTHKKQELGDKKVFICCRMIIGSVWNLIKFYLGIGL